MARPLRIEYPGAWYHVMNRGQGRRQIFHGDHHRQYFLSLLAETAARYNADWHAYCLMGNHYHLMLHTPEGNLQRILRHLNGLYTQYYNRSTRHDGPLFRGRYKAILVDAQSYWLQLSRYIHHNPLQAGLVTRLADYPWSSYPAYIGQVKAPAWLSTDYILHAMGQRQRHRRYADYVDEGTDPALAQFYAGKRQAPLLGDTRFRTRALAGKAETINLPELRAARSLPGLDTIAQAVCRHLQVEPKTVWHKTRGRGSTGPARSVTMYLCQRIGGMTLSEIAEVFDLASYASAGSSIRALKQRLQDAPALRRQVDYILLDLTP
jgi:putative transposase